MSSSDLAKTNQAAATSARDAAAILGFADSLDGRALVSESDGDLLPYEVEFEALAEIIEVKAQKNHDSRGIRVKLKIVESTNPKDVKVNRTYTLWFFDQHKTLPDMVLKQMVEDRIRFAATIDGYQGDPLEPLADGSPKYKSAPKLAELHNEVEPLGIQLRFQNRYTRTTRNNKRLHKLSFELA